MNRTAVISFLTIGMGLLVVGLFLGNQTVHANDITCGTAFHPNMHQVGVQELTQTLSGNTDFTQYRRGCETALDSRKTVATVITGIGGVLMVPGIIGIVMAVVKARMDDERRERAKEHHVLSTPVTPTEPPVAPKAQPTTHIEPIEEAEPPKPDGKQPMSTRKKLGITAAIVIPIIAIGTVTATIQHRNEARTVAAVQASAKAKVQAEASAAAADDNDGSTTASDDDNKLSNYDACSTLFMGHGNPVEVVVDGLVEATNHPNSPDVDTDKLAKALKTINSASEDAKPKLFDSIYTIYSLGDDLHKALVAGSGTISTSGLKSAVNNVMKVCKAELVN